MTEETFIAEREKLFNIPSLPSSFIRDRYTFLGWSRDKFATEPEFGGLINPGQALFDKDTTLYAIWTPTYCNVTFDSCGGDIDFDRIEIVRGQCVEQMPKTGRENYKFLGWYTSPVGGIAITGQTPITEDSQLFAHWYGQEDSDPSPSPDPSPDPDPDPSPDPEPSVKHPAKAALDASGRPDPDKYEKIGKKASDMVTRAAKWFGPVNSGVRYKYQGQNTSCGQYTSHTRDFMYEDKKTGDKYCAVDIMPARDMQSTMQVKYFDTLVWQYPLHTLKRWYLYSGGNPTCPAKALETNKPGDGDYTNVTSFGWDSAIDSKSSADFKGMKREWVNFSDYGRSWVNTNSYTEKGFWFWAETLPR